MGILCSDEKHIHIDGMYTMFKIIAFDLVVVLKRIKVVESRRKSTNYTTIQEKLDQRLFLKVATLGLDVCGRFDRMMEII